MVELVVLLVLDVRRALQPQGMGVVDLLRLGRFLFLLAFLGCLHFRCVDWHGHELAVLLQRLPQRPQAGKLLVLVVQIQGDGRAARHAVGILKVVLHAVLADPAHGLRALLIAHRVDDDLLRDHEHRIEAEAEVADDAVRAILRLVLFQKLLCAGERHLRDVLFDLLRGHADAVVAKGERVLLGIGHHVDAPGVFALALGQFRLAHGEKTLHLAHRVAAVGDHFAHKYILVGIQPFFDDWHDVLRIDGDRALFSHVNRLHIFGSITILVRKAELVNHSLALFCLEC